MKALKFYSIVSVVFSILLTSCCGPNITEYRTKMYIPVYKSLAEIRSEVKTDPPHDFVNPGKIYIFGSFIFVNEKGEGIHIIDNSDHSNPKFISFIVIPGNGDLAVKNNILYADSYIDLLAFDITDPTNVKLTKRIEGIFPNPLDRTDQYIDPEKGLLVEWAERDTVIRHESDCDDVVYSPFPGGGVYYGGRLVGVDDASGGPNSGGGKEGGGGDGPPSGKGGSMARLTIVRDFMYSVDRTDLQTFDISTPEDPKSWTKINIGWNIETIYPFKNRLFIGSMNGMFIYDATNPANPVLLGQFSHATACDPVAADDKYAYVTLRSGTRCAGIQNQLDVLDITTITNPQLIKTYPMQEPAGLGLDGNALFICDGKAGLKVFDKSAPLDLKLLDWESNLHTYDIIPMGDYALVVGEDGLYIYDYSNPKDLKLLSRIPVKK